MRHPNILLVLTDQQRADTLACYGNDYVQAPHLNRLAAESFVFRNAYCPQPKCTPSRASILTGMWPHAHGCIANNIALPGECATIAERLPEAYHCAYYGKWHLGDEIRAQRGFGEWLSIEDGGGYREQYTDPKLLDERSDYHGFLESKGYTPLKTLPDGSKVFSREFAAALPEPYTKASFLGDEAARFLAEYDRDAPFFLCVGFLEPHPPNWSPFNELHDPCELPVGDAFFHPPGEGAPELVRRIARDHAEHGCRDFPARTEADWRRIRANYYGQVTLVDRAMGKILAALDESGKASETLVVFVSDHGEMSGDHAIGKKGITYESAVRVPWLVRAPWIARKQRMLEKGVSLIDLAPTILDFVDGADAAGMQGGSLREVLEGGDAAGTEKSVFIENYTAKDGRYLAWRTIISGDRWKMTLCAEDRCELYYLENDPWELRNLYTDPAHANRIRRLREDIVEWQRRTGDPCRLQEAP